MEMSNYYETIFKRKSIRKFELKPLDKDKLLEIDNFAKSLSSLFSDIKTEIRIVSRDKVKLLMPIKAPHYLLFYSEEKDGYLTNAGYKLQQMDLFFSLNNIGSCYLGIGQPSKIEKGMSKLKFVMMMAIGTPVGSLHRVNVSDFKRKPISKIVNKDEDKDEGINKIIEAASVAPSAMNSQPWFFVIKKAGIHVYCVKQNFIKGVLYNKMNKVDMGIVLCHLAIALENQNKKFSFIYDKKAIDIEPKGYSYTISLSLQ